ncbi:MAG TPA: glycoside hydrolase family 43 protein [Fimbriimonas sp.]
MSTITNPLLSFGPDPWIVFHKGFYYFTYTGHDRIPMRRAESLADLPRAEEVSVWSDAHPMRCTEMWAPELYLLNGPNGRRWYIYYTASDGQDLNHRCFVLEGDSSDPLGPYAFKAQLKTDPEDRLYAIDGHVLVKADGSQYLLWAGHPGHRIFIQRLENPWTTAGARVKLEADGFGCEEVREGPVALQKDGKIFLIYSMCDTGKPDYRLGMLWCHEADDVLDAASWRQWPEPVFTRNDAAEVYGPGHNGFFKSPDGTEDWIVYHAKDTAEYSYNRRNPRVQPFTWRKDGTPDFGRPVPVGKPVPLPSGDLNRR